MLSFESPKGVAIIPALLLPPNKKKRDEKKVTNLYYIFNNIAIYQGK